MELRNRSLRERLKVPTAQTGVVVTKVSSLAPGLVRHRHPLSLLWRGAFSRRRCCVGQDLKEDDVIIAIDRKELGDDFTVELRESELVGADYLITCERPAGCCMLVHLRPVFVAAGKERGKPTHFSCLRGGGAHEFEVVLQPLPHVIPRCHGFDCKPSYLLRAISMSTCPHSF